MNIETLFDPLFSNIFLPGVIFKKFWSGVWVIVVAGVGAGAGGWEVYNYWIDYMESLKVVFEEI